MKEYLVDVQFRVKANDPFEASRKVHGFVPDVDEDIVEWIVASYIIPNCSDTPTEVEQ